MWDVPFLRSKNEDQNGSGNNVRKDRIECPEGFHSPGATSTTFEGEVGRGELGGQL